MAKERIVVTLVFSSLLLSCQSRTRPVAPPLPPLGDAEQRVQVVANDPNRNQWLRENCRVIAARQRVRGPTSCSVAVVR